MTNHPKFDTDQFIADLSPELRPLYDELYLYASTADQSDDKYLLRLALEYKKMHIAQTIQSLSKESEKDTDEQVGKLNADMVAVEKRLKLL
jgi:hypothetical protein